jgi:hypothetical protein
MIGGAVPTAAEIQTAYDQAATPLRTLRTAAVDAGDRGLAGVVSATLDDLRARYEQAQGADLLTRWTAARAADTLATATPAIPATHDGAVATVDLPTGGVLRIVPTAHRRPLPGYDVVVRDTRGRPTGRYRAKDNPTLVSLVGTLRDAAVAA